MKTCIQALVIICLCIFTTVAAHAQQGKTKITGTIVNNEKKPVEFATVTLHTVKDSALVKGAVADINGYYEFDNIPPGKYFLAGTNMGMTKNYSPAFDLKGESKFAAPQIILQPSTKSLKEVNVVAQKPFIEQRADKTVVNVENSIVGAGSTAMEVLQKSPGVTVDKDDNVSLKGKAGVLIMIDGKITNMTQADLAQWLKSMPSSNVEQIELISNPSSKYDAAGTAGIINIKLKKNKNYGTNGSISLNGGAGDYGRINSSLSLNHRNAKFNVFGNLNYGQNGNYENLLVDRTTTVEKDLQFMNQQTFLSKHYEYYGAKVGADYFIDDNHIIGVIANGNLANWAGKGKGTTGIGANNRIDSTLRTITDNSANWDRYAFNVNYKGKLDTTGREINVDLDYARNMNKGTSFIFSKFERNNVLSPEDVVRNMTPSNIDIKTAKIDYIHPLRNNAKFELGFKTSFVKSDNNLRFDSLRKNVYMLDTTRSNTFLYEENINAAYLNYSKQFKKFGIQLGLRAEQTNITGTSRGTGKVNTPVVNDSSYVNLFPSVFVSYNASANHTWGVSYSRRLQRPSYDDLNPFETYLDQYTKVAGNPGLRPQYSNNFELSYTFKSMLSASLGYSHTKDVIMRIIEADVDQSSGDTLILKYRYQNVAERDNISLNLSAPVPITKWWNSFTTVSIYYNGFNTMVSNNLVKLSSTAVYAQMQHTFTLPKNYSIEVTGQYVSPQVADEGLFRMKAMGGVDIGARKTLWDKKATFSLTVSDIFRTNHFTGVFDNANRSVRLANKWESRTIRAAFVYRFGNNNVKEARNRSTGVESELNRAK